MLMIPVSYQDKDVENVEKVLNKEFSSLCEWFVDNKLWIHVGYDKTKTISFSQKKSLPKLSVSYRDYSLKQFNTVEYLECYLDINFIGESVDHRVLKTINTKRSFLWSQSNYLNYLPRGLLCNAFIQSHFDSGCTLWCPVLSKTLKTKFQIAQNKSTCFYLELPCCGHISPSHFWKINWIYFQCHI